MPSKFQKLSYTPSFADPHLIQQASDYLDSVYAHPERLTEAMNKFLSEADNQGLADALIYHLDSDKTLKRAFAAYSILLGLSNNPKFAPPAVQERCQHLLIALLSSKSSETRRYAASFLAFAGCPEGAVPKLIPLLADPIPLVAFAASMALATAKTPPTEAIRYLQQSLKSTDKATAQLAAISLLQIGIRSEDVERALVEGFAELSPLVQRPILLAAAKIGPAAGFLRTHIQSILTDKRQESISRASAAQALVSVSRDDSPEILPALLDDSDLLVREGALAGWPMSRPVPPRVTEILISQLDVDDAEARRLAAQWLGPLGALQSLEPYLERLMDRLSIETDHDTLIHVADALGRVGPAAIALLLDAVRTSQISLVWHAGHALVRIGKPAAEAIAAILLSLEPIQILNMMQILQGMGEDAGPVVPLLTQMLECLDNEPLIVLILETLVSAGKAAGSATHAVIDAICRFDMEHQREIAGLIARFLDLNQPASITALQKAASKASGYDRVALSAMLERFPNPMKTQALLPFKSTEKIKNFVAMAERLQASGGKSMRTLSEELVAERRNSKRKIDKLSANTLTRDLNDIRRTAGKPVVKRTGEAYTLTEFGLELLERCEEYLADTRHKTREKP